MSIDTTKMSSSDLRRQACRLGGHYIIGQARMLTEVLDQNFVSVLVFLAILRANVGGITESRDRALRHLALTETPSDDHRLPVSAYALARDLSIPYETVRRHVHKLRKADLCVLVAGGAVVPTRLLVGSTARGATLAAQRDVRALVNEAGRFGIVGRPQVGPTTVDAPLQVARLSTDYFLDGIGLMSQTHGVDVVSALALHALGLMNTAHLSRDLALGSEFGGLDDIPPDELRTPVSVYAVSRFLRLPYETTRRTFLRLEEANYVRRHSSGALTIPTEVIARPELVAGYARFGELTQTFLDRLAEYGVAPQPSADRRPRGAELSLADGARAG
jgi:DNA-binding transcriptional regulator YhcF (GntR family)